MRVLVLDDDNTRHKTFKKNLIGHDVVHVHTYDEAVTALEGERFNVMYLDHDLNLEGIHRSVMIDEETGIEWELTGADVARAIVALPSEKHPERTIVHSYNPSGAANIVAILHDARIEAVRNLFSGSSGLEISGE